MFPSKWEPDAEMWAMKALLNLYIEFYIELQLKKQRMTQINNGLCFSLMKYWIILTQTADLTGERDGLQLFLREKTLLAKRGLKVVCAVQKSGSALRNLGWQASESLLERKRQKADLA